MKRLLQLQSGQAFMILLWNFHSSMIPMSENAEQDFRVVRNRGFPLDVYKRQVLDFAEALPGEKLDGLKVTPGAYLGSCRYKLPESLEDPVYPRLFKKFEEMNIGWFFYIGGNDSMDTVSKLSRYAAQTGSDIRILGEPKTIDNDLIHTDHTLSLIHICHIYWEPWYWLTVSGR